MKKDYQLIEFKDVPQNEKGIRRRIFANKDRDLIIWYDLKNTIIGFQLTYDTIAVTYADNKFNINSIDSCEKDNFAPILTGSPDIDIQHVIDYIDIHCLKVDKEIIDYMKAVLVKRLQTNAS